MVQQWWQSALIFAAATATGLLAALLSDVGVRLAARRRGFQHFLTQLTATAATRGAPFWCSVANSAEAGTVADYRRIVRVEWSVVKRYAAEIDLSVVRDPLERPRRAQPGALLHGWWQK